MDFLLRSGRDEQASPYSNIGDQYYSPDTSDVLKAFTEEAFKGIGTGYADVQALNVSQLQRVGEPLTEETYKSSPYFRPGVPFSRDMTTESVKVLAEYHDDREKNAFIINHASNAQKAAGYTTAFSAGIFEPKNIATGVAASAILSPIVGGLAPAGSSLRRVLQLKKALGRYGDKAVIGGVEGMVAAAAAEPSNQYSASILKQDYGMSDSLWNIGLSTAFGIGFNTAPSFIKEKWTTHGGNTPDIIAHEMDTAVNQLVASQKVDVSHVEKASLGEIASKPIAEQAKAVESFVRYTDTPEFKARFEGSKVVDEQGQPLRVYHGTDKQFDTFDISKAGQRDAGWMGEAIYLTGDPKLASNYASMGGEMDISGVREGANVRPSYVKIEKPYITDNALLSKSFVKQLREDGYDGILAYKQVFDGEGVGKPNEIAVFSPDQIIPAFGADNMDAIARRLDAENKTSLNKSVLDSVNPENDTALDVSAAKELDSYDATLKADDAAVKASYDKYLEEIAFMKKEGMMTDAEIEIFTDAINSVNEKDIQSGYDALLACLTRG